ncbi:hypothetical protein [Streptomyces sp. NPDC087856]|uniref:hypothetical protein n=1 Tax=Streptomyces sp. NPDC087856 TaxID=3365811 RepID=UPI00382E6513
MTAEEACQMTVEANIEFLGIKGTRSTRSNPGRHISPTEQLAWIFDELPTAIVVEMRIDRRTRKSAFLTSLYDDAARQGWTAAFDNAVTQPLRGITPGPFAGPRRSAGPPRRLPEDDVPRPPRRRAAATCLGPPGPPKPLGRYEVFRSVRALSEPRSAHRGARTGVGHHPVGSTGQKLPLGRRRRCRS